jgi:NAD(P)-dependent dehydrogenase (short-subunit alcohol dehydrogenase family)
MARKVAIVTGGGRGIGRAHALALAGRGYAVVVNDLGVSLEGQGTAELPTEQVVAEIVGRGGEATSSHLDVGDWDRAEELVATAVERYGQLDVLINNAGIVREMVLCDLDAYTLDAVIRVHLRATIATSHFAAVHWRERHQADGPVGGRLINTTSASAFWGNPGQANYTEAKGTIVAFTLTASRELARYGVTANVIAPGAPSSRLLASILDVNRVAALDPSYIARIAAWLCTDDAAGVTGRILSVSGERVQVIQGGEAGPWADVPAHVTVDDLSSILPRLIAGARANTPPATTSS